MYRARRSHVRVLEMIRPRETPLELTVLDRAAAPAGGRPAVFLSMAHWFGTLAAVRELGRRGIAAHVAASAPLRQASWSRYATRRPSCPSERDARAYLGWLLEYGRRHPGLVLCATSDDLSFLYAAHERELRKSFRLATPGLEVLREVLDKRRLHEHADRVGLRTPATFFPESADDAVARASSAGWVPLIKQRTQVFSRTLDKGLAVRDGGSLRRLYQAFTERNQFDPEVLARWPDVDRPMLQEYLPRSAEGMYCLSGYLAPNGRFATRAARKLLSHPRYLGIGLLFEDAEVVPALEERVIELCRSIGFRGVFQCEFLVHDDEYLLIDFNPRFYNYMAFDHARGLPQAFFDYLCAIGAREELDEELERARSPRPRAGRQLYSYRLGTFIQLRLEALFRRIPRDEPARWRAWGDGAASIVDPAWSPDDPRPALADLLLQLWRLCRHPRSFLRANTSRVL